jgi:hypothetical protein
MKKHKKFKLKTWWLLIGLIPLLFLDATMLRMNHIKMTELRDAVLTADAEEDDEKTVKALEELKNYVFSEVVINIVDENGNYRIMFGTGPFYLEHQYLRAARAALEKAEAEMTSDENPNGNVYALASGVCRPLAIANRWSWDNANYINCMISEIQKYPAADEIQDKVIASLPSTELYRREYASPVWAPTFTGIMILITLVIVVVIFIRLLVWIILRLSLLFI